MFLSLFLHIWDAPRDSAKEALSFVNNRTREDLDHERMLSLALVRLIEIMGEGVNIAKLSPGAR